MIKNAYKLIVIIFVFILAYHTAFSQSFGYMGKKNFIGIETNFNTNIDRTYLTEFKNNRSFIRPEGLDRFNGSIGIRFERISSSFFSNYIAIHKSKTDFFLNNSFRYNVIDDNSIKPYWGGFYGLVNVKSTNLTLGQKYIKHSNSYPIGYYFSYELVIGFHTAQLDSSFFTGPNYSIITQNMLAYKANFISYTARLLYGNQFQLSDMLALDFNIGFGLVLNSPVVYDELNDKTYDPRETDLQKTLAINSRRALLYKNLIMTRVALNLVY